MGHRNTVLWIELVSEHQVFECPPDNDLESCQLADAKVVAADPFPMFISVSSLNAHLRYGCFLAAGQRDLVIPDACPH